MLILDEPTSGVDPVARDRFWELLIDLSREQGVTIFVSTHFMNEAERCDRISLMDAGRVLATGHAAASDRRGAAPRTLEDAFIGYLEEASGAASSRAAGRIVDRRDRPWPAAAAAARPRSIASSSACAACSPTRSARRWSCCAIRSGWLRAVRHGLSDAGFRLRHHDRRR